MKRKRKDKKEKEEEAVRAKAPMRAVSVSENDRTAGGKKTEKKGAKLKWNHQFGKGGSSERMDVAR